MQKGIKYSIFFMSIICFILCLLEFFPFFSYILSEKALDVNDIKASYEENQMLFVSSITEFSQKKEEPIYLKDEKFKIIDIKDYNNSDPHINENGEKYKKNLKKYKVSLNLMKKLNIKEIRYEYGNIEYVYNYYHFSTQSIVYVVDMKSYIMKGRMDFTKRENLGNGWWYMEY